MPWEKAKETEGEVLKEYAILNAIPSKKILVRKEVENTADDAVSVKELISPSRRIILVTSAYHKYRSKRNFENQGFIVTPYKADYKSERNKEITLLDFLLIVDNLKTTETGFSEIIGRILQLINN